MGSRFFIAGTDTDVGKSLVAAAMLAAVNARGLRCLGLKPLAAGAEESDQGWRNSDAELLRQHASVQLPYTQVNPVLLRAPMAPHLAAQLEGKRLSSERLAGFCRGALSTPADLLLVEGAGGWRVPLNNRELLSDLPRTLQLPVILVVGIRLGCLNHALLTAEAIRRDGLPLVGWVANVIDPQMAEPDANIATLAGMLGAPLLGVIPHLPQANPVDASQFLGENFWQIIGQSVNSDKA